MGRAICALRMVLTQRLSFRVEVREEGGLREEHVEERVDVGVYILVGHLLAVAGGAPRVQRLGHGVGRRHRRGRGRGCRRRCHRDARD